MSDLVAFLNARLDEDEAVAKAANGLSWYADAMTAEEALTEGDMSPEGLAWVMNEHMHMFDTDTATATHIARHDPDRVLRWVKAGQAIIDLASEATGLDMQVDMEFRTTTRDTSADPYCGNRILRHLAAVYSDHPDYDEKWRP